MFEDGKPQQIQTFSYIELPIERANRFQAFGRPVPADVRSNRDVSSGRVYVIVLDDLNVAPIRTALVRRSARQFIEQHFGLHDLAAIVVTSGRKEAAQEFTSDPALLLGAIDISSGSVCSRPNRLRTLPSGFNCRFDTFAAGLAKWGALRFDRPPSAPGSAAGRFVAVPRPCVSALKHANEERATS